METNTNLESKIEAILFFKGEPMTLSKLGDMLSASEEEVRTAIEALKQSFSNRGIAIIQREDEVTLGTAPEYSELIENIQKDELNKDLSKAALETLSIVLYKNGASRTLIDYVRGVNSSFTLRALSIRGLVERVPDPADNRKFIFKPTLELLSYMGITDISELPEYNQVSPNIDQAQTNLEETLKQAEPAN